MILSQIYASIFRPPAPRDPPMPPLDLAAPRTGPIRLVRPGPGRGQTGRLGPDGPGGIAIAWRDQRERGRKAPEDQTAANGRSDGHGSNQGRTRIATQTRTRTASLIDMSSILDRAGFLADRDGRCPVASHALRCSSISRRTYSARRARTRSGSRDDIGKADRRSNSDRTHEDTRDETRRAPRREKVPRAFTTSRRPSKGRRDAGTAIRRWYPDGRRTR